MINGRYEIESYREAIFNPNALYAFSHMWLACLQTSTFVIGGISAWYILRGQHVAFFLRSFSIAVIAAVIITPLQVFIGDSSGLSVFEHQPAKLAAIEGHWETNPPGEGADWSLLAWPDKDQQQNRWSVEIPGALSLLLTHDATGQVRGLRDFPVADQPPAMPLLYYSFRGMVAIGFLMLFLALWAGWRKYRGAFTPENIIKHPRLLRVWVLCIPIGYVAVELGWIVREVGRQPWVLYGIMRTEAGASPLPAGILASTLAVYTFIYVSLTIIFIVLSRRMLFKGPDLDIKPLQANKLPTHLMHMPDTGITHNMDLAYMLLIEIWFAILGLFLIFYVVLDGFDLGIGIISLLAKTEERRDVMMNSVGSVWDANETWLVVFGGALFGAFPAAYAAILHGLYIPVSLMLFALIFRGISFEFREHGKGHHKGRWSLAFGYGSLVGALMQGFALGAVIGGFPVVNGAFAGSVWHWLSLFTLLTALGVVFGYVLLGACYLIMKTQGEIQQRMYRIASIGAVLMAVCGIAVSVWTPLRFDYVAERWLSWPNLLYLAPLPSLAILAYGMLLRALYKRQEHAPFVWSVLIFVFSFLGLAVTLFPYLVPDVLSIYDAAAKANTLVFMLTGIGMLIPIMIIYNAYQYLVFRGKVSDQGGH